MKKFHLRFVIFRIAATLVISNSSASAESILLPKGAKTEWKYLDNGTNPGKAWAGGDFDDSKWKKGKAPLGYGERNLGTEISFGEDSNRKHITSYFRTSLEINAEELKKIEQLGFRLRRDDGALVYLNGEEIIRSNMREGPVKATTLAAAALSTAQETQFQFHLVPASTLAGKEGPHIVAVEIHQAGSNSSDTYVDLEIVAYAKGEAPKRDFYREGMAALSRRQFEEAAKLLKQMDPAHPEYAETMAMLAHRVYAEALGRGSEGIPLAKIAYDLAPENRNVVQAYMKTHLLSGVLFDKKDIARERPKTVPEEFKFLVSHLKFPGRSRRIPRAQLEADLDYLEHIMVHCFAYLELRDVDYRGALDAVRISLEDETPVDAFEICLAKLISLFCDGHARVTHHESQFLPRGYAPFLAGTYKDRIYLRALNGSGFIDPEHPYVTAMDGKPIQEWMKVAGYLVVKESPQWHRRGALENFAYVSYLRSELGLPQKEELRLTLQSEDGKKTKKITVKVQRRLPRPVRFPMGSSRKIGEVGYLRIPSMTSDQGFLSEVEEWMDKFKNTKGLIIDLRGNTGGSKAVLFLLAPYFLKLGDPLYIVEFSAYRKPVDVPKPPPNGFMRSETSGQPVTAARWKNDAERKQIAEVIAKFQPAWKLPMEKFSRWHVVGLDASVNPDAYYYDKPLIILQDTNSFSASDIFLGGFENHPNTTLMGVPSGGGNGWMERFVLPKTRLGVILCVSAKFRPNGKPYDGEGIPPDVRMEATPQDVISGGKSDSVLDAAVKRLNGAEEK